MNAKVTEPDVLVRSAVHLMQAGELPAAEDQCRRALTLDASHVDALSVLGMIELAQSRFAEAETVFDHLVQLKPDEPAFWLNLAAARRGNGRYDEALPAFARAATLGEDSGNFHYLLGLTHYERLDLESAKSVFARGMTVAPEDAEMRLRFAQVCYEATCHDEALTALEAWPTPEATPLEVTAGVGNLLMNLGQTRRAEATLRTAIATRPGDLNLLLTLVQFLERTNQVDEAADRLSTLLSDPKSELLGTELGLTRARVEQRQSHHELALEVLIQSMPDFKQAHQRHLVLFPMAQSLDALGRHDDAFEAVTKAHRSQVAQVERTAPLAALRGPPQMKVTEFECSATDVALWDHSSAPPAERSPIFVVAFPRSGTTLLEVTLDAHPGLKSMDEQPFIQNALEDMTALGVHYPDELGRLQPDQLEQIRAAYWNRVGRQVTLAPGERLIDKNPLNILRLPVIRRLFPNSPVILAVRHPCDVVLSCYMQHFRAPDWALLCSSLPALVRGYRKTFDYWYRTAALVAPRVMEIRYEQMVNEFESTVRKMTEFLDLPWDDALLHPAEHARAKRYISTPSYAQVAEPVHGRAVGRWERYRHHLEPVLPELAPYITRWNYDV